ncbi:hypothetical protein [Yoonia sediminilitoris]|uniref:Uncharacterized protein n=1 Tax=Yoonia sediminilitoris TaxID=1286148 RepID=A0A2T6KK67_9RHOB|nr:hypothetical protein [Yoonia sediminilitoris]PUB16360.1 hypothetical protein C8N45_103215 [Yoonia sediminilitoris]RCW96709.1 hypothetical protein DFP92_103215 [Yoonia sediminilitoris]
MSIKTLILAAAAATVTASAGAADTYFEVGPNLEAGDILELGLITADGKGIVEIYDFRTGTQGKLLGTQSLNAGANPDVRVKTGLPATGNVLAVVKVDGATAATKSFYIY